MTVYASERARRIRRHRRPARRHAAPRTLLEQLVLDLLTSAVLFVLFLCYVAAAVTLPHLGAVHW